MTPWKPNSYFGMYSLKSLYLFFNIKSKSEVPSLSLPFFSYAQGSSNIYSSLTCPLQDFGFAGMLITRFLLAYISIKIEDMMFDTNVNDVLVPIKMTIMCLTLYCFIYVGIADMAPSLFFNPSRMLQLGFGYFCAYFTANYYFIDSEGRKLHLKHKIRIGAMKQTV